LDPVVRTFGCLACPKISFGQKALPAAPVGQTAKIIEAGIVRIERNRSIEMVYRLAIVTRKKPVYGGAVESYGKSV
jgi:hypothetical protein